MPAITLEVIMNDKDKKTESMDYTDCQVEEWLSRGIDEKAARIRRKAAVKTKNQPNEFPKETRPYISVA
jgi:hypothetical protein